MIVTELYNGQGLGNQLWCYFVTRVIAEKNNYSFGIMSPEKFKGSDFIELDFGNKVIGGCGPEGGPPKVLPDNILHYYTEKMVWEPSHKLLITKLDQNLLKVEDNTKIDGLMQDENYIHDFKNKICEWFKIKEEKNIKDFATDDVCIIHVRGGDFKHSLALLDKSYYDMAIEKMRSIKNIKKFLAVTDDINYCKSILPNIEIISSSTDGIDSKKASHHLGGPICKDFTILMNSKYSIISSSSFSWWASWINKNNKFLIAPKYWAAYKFSGKFWSLGGSLTRGWNYLDNQGELFSYEECEQELLK